MAKFIKGLLWVAGILAVLILIGRATLFRVWTVPEDPILAASLGPTLAGGDVVLVMTRGERGANDLVRCTDPDDSQRWVVGRIYGQQGDRIEVNGGIVTLNGRRYTTSEQCLEDQFEVKDPYSGAPKKVGCSRIEFAGGWHFVGMGNDARSETDSEHLVGPGNVFLVSDNREMHEDSRDFGSLPKWTCRDRVFFRLWSKNGFGDDQRRLDYLR